MTEKQLQRKSSGIEQTYHTIQCHANHVFHPTTDKYVRTTCLYSNKQQHGFNTYITPIMINNIVLLIRT